MKKKILVLGIGNFLMGDEAIGIHVVREFEAKNNFVDFVDVVDGGTGGFHLLSFFRDYEKIIIVDAALGDKISGTIEVIKPKYPTDFPRTLTAHDIGLKDLVESASILGYNPEVFLLIIYIDKFQNMELNLSQSVSESIPKAVNTLNDLINNLIESDKS